MALPLFYGEEEEDAYWWILCIEKIFKEQGTRETLKVVKAITSFRGHALHWWIWRSQYKAPTTWDTFTTVFLFHFKPEWREILPIEDEEEQPYQDSTISVDEASIHDEFVVEQIPAIDGDLKESSSDLYDEVEPDLTSMTTIKKTCFLENFVLEPVSSIDERIVIPMLKLKQQQIDSLVFTVSTPCSKIIDSVCVVKSNSTPMGSSDEVEFSVTPIPPKPPDSPSLRVSNATTPFYSKPFDFILKEKRLLPISDPDILSTSFPSEFASSKDAHDFLKSFLHKPSLLELESRQSMESTSFQKKFELSSLFQICQPTHNLALGDGFYPVATTLDDTIIHSLYIFQAPTTLDTSVKLVVETQFKDEGFHDDADFAIPPKPPDHIVIGFLCCRIRESKHYHNIGYSDAVHHLFVKIPLLDILSIYWCSAPILFANLVFSVFDLAHLLEFEKYKLNPNFSSLSSVELAPPELSDQSCSIMVAKKIITYLESNIVVGTMENFNEDSHGHSNVKPMSMVLPGVIEFKLLGKLRSDVTATDLVLTVTQLLRKHRVVGKFVEFYGQGLRELPLADCTTIANMSPEYGATMGFFTVDHVTLQYLKLIGRSYKTVPMIESYLPANKMFVDYSEPQVEIVYSFYLELNLEDVEPCVSCPKRPRDRVILKEMKSDWHACLNNKVGFKGFNVEKETQTKAAELTFCETLIVLNDMHINIMDYIASASCTDVTFRTMWVEFEWESKVVVNIVLQDERDFFGHIIKSTYMKRLTLPFALEGEYGFLVANLYAILLYIHMQNHHTKKNTNSNLYIILALILEP